MVYGYLFDDMLEKILWHPILSVSDQISDEVMPLLLKDMVCYFYLNPWDIGYWRLFVQPRTRIWEIPGTTDHSEDLWGPPGAVIYQARHTAIKLHGPRPEKLTIWTQRRL